MTHPNDLYLDHAIRAAQQLNASVDAREKGQVEKAGLLRAAAGRTLGEARDALDESKEETLADRRTAG